MSDEVEIKFDNASEQATLLLAAAEDLEMDPSVVRTGTGVFYVPQDVADKAGLKPDEDTPAKKTAAKKTAAKKN